MPAAAVDTAFKTRLRDNWTTSVVVDGLGASDPQTVTDPPAGVDVFLLVQYPVVNGEKPALSRHYLEEGVARLVLNAKTGLGLPTVLAWGDELASLFRSLKPKDFGGVETFAPGGSVINDANDDGNWFELSVPIPYRYQFDD